VLNEVDRTPGGKMTVTLVRENEEEKELEELEEELERVAFRVPPLCEVYVVNPSVVPLLVVDPKSDATAVELIVELELV
jgi:hypothetical protein